jgi:hypothetical protein
MKSEHIINLIESTPLSEIAESDLAIVRAHVVVCASCNQAFQAARMTALMLKERAAETFEPTPFFQTRVLAALRERKDEQWSWSKMWQATGALASSMVATVAAIAVLTFVIPSAPSEDLTSANNTYSAEAVILNQNDAAENQLDQTDAQVLTTLYGAEEER